MHNNIVRKQSKSKINPKCISTFEHHINFLKECTEHDDDYVTHYFLDKALESFNKIEV